MYWEVIELIRNPGRPGYWRVAERFHSQVDAEEWASEHRRITAGEKHIKDVKVVESAPRPRV